jgi:aspartyl aminopeptidase
LISAVDRSVNENLTFNQETQFVPILGLIGKQLNAPKDDGLPSFALVPDSASSIQGKHHPGLLSLLATELSVAVDRIHDFELYEAFPHHLNR